MQQFTIGEIPRATGLAASAIRYYEECGVLPQADRQHNNRRCYGPETLEALHFVSACRKNGMGLVAIRDLQAKLVGMQPQCEKASAILHSTITELTARIAELQAARRHLSKVASACSAEICGRSDATCNISRNMSTAGAA